MKSPLRYPGGKTRAIKHLLPHIPEGETFVPHSWAVGLWSWCLPKIERYTLTMRSILSTTFGMPTHRQRQVSRRSPQATPARQDWVQDSARTLKVLRQQSPTILCCGCCLLLRSIAHRSQAQHYQAATQASSRRSLQREQHQKAWRILTHPI